MISTNAIAGCEDPINDGVDYTNCRFSDGQYLQGSYLPNSKLSFTSFIQVNFDKSIMMSSNLSFGTFPESSFIRANLYESILVGANFEKANSTLNFVKNKKNIIFITDISERLNEVILCTYYSCFTLD